MVYIHFYKTVKKILIFRLKEKSKINMLSTINVKLKVDLCYVEKCDCLFALQLVKSCNDGARRMERTEHMYTIQKQMDFGKIKVSACAL